MVSLVFFIVLIKHPIVISLLIEPKFRLIMRQNTQKYDKNTDFMHFRVERRYSI